MFGLTLAFAEKTISGLVFSALIVGIASYFGQPFIFDPIILIAFIAIALAFRRNIDLLSICAIFIAERGLEELMWRFLENSVFFKIPSYLICFVICCFLSVGTTRIYAAAFIGLATILEVYWGLIDYEGPFILWFCYLFTMHVVIRRFLRMRVFWLIEVNPNWSPSPLRLDSQLLLANAGFIISISFVVFEYYLRHLTNVKMTIFYEFVPYFHATISIFILYSIVVQSISHLKALELSA